LTPRRRAKCGSGPIWLFTDKFSAPAPTVFRSFRRSYDYL